MKVDYSPFLHVSDDGAIWWRVGDALKLGAGYVPVGSHHSGHPLLRAPNEHVLACEKNLIEAFYLRQTDCLATATALREDGQYVKAYEFLNWRSQYVTGKPEKGEIGLDSHVAMEALRWSVRKALEARRATIDSARPLSVTLSEWFETRFEELPERIQVIVEAAIYSKKWDWSSPIQRRDMAARIDHPPRPLTEQEEYRSLQRMQERARLWSDIQELEALPAQTLAEKFMKDDRLNALYERLRLMGEQLSQDELPQLPFESSAVMSRSPKNSTPNKLSKQDDIAIELECVMSTMSDAGELITAASVMRQLQARVGARDTCIRDSFQDGVVWLRGSNGQLERLTHNQLAHRLKRLRKGSSAGS